MQDSTFEPKVFPLNLWADEGGVGGREDIQQGSRGRTVEKQLLEEKFAVSFSGLH